MTHPPPVQIAGFRRTPIAKRGGELSSVGAVELASIAGRAVLSEREDLARRVTHAIYGSSRLAGQGPNAGRQFALRCGLPEAVPATTVTSACSSGLEAVISAWRMIALAEADVVLVGAGESMSKTPVALFREWRKEGSQWRDLHISDGLMCPITGMLMAEQAEALARTRGYSRERCDSVVLASHRKYALFRDLHRRDIVCVSSNGRTIDDDVLVRGEEKLARMSSLPPLFGEGGIQTAASVSAVADGGAAMLITSSDGAAALAELVAYVTVAASPEATCTMPVQAIRRLGDSLKMNVGEFGAVEINEGFAAQVIACCEDLGLEADKVNPFGGTLACGHPTGMTGLRLLGLHARALAEREHRDAIVSVPITGGMGTAVYLRKAR